MKPLSKAVRVALLGMLYDLDHMRLEVALVPSRRPHVAAQGGKIRVPVSHNPTWYQDFCRAHPSSRKRDNQAFDTRIRRHDARTSLRMLLAGRCTSRYAVDLLAAAERIVKDEALQASTVDKGPDPYAKTLATVSEDQCPLPF